MPAPVAHRETRCERCYYTVWPQFSWCEAPCDRAGTWAKGRWQICGTCGAMRCDPAPVTSETKALQQCMCDFAGGPECWGAAQRVAKERYQRVTWCR